MRFVISGSYTTSPPVCTRDEPSDTIEQCHGLEPILILAWYTIAPLAGMYTEYVPFTPNTHTQTNHSIFHLGLGSYKQF